MTVEYIRYTIDSARSEQFIEDYTAAAESLRTSPHALSWELTYADEDPTQFILRIEWDSADGHMQGFRKSADFRTFFGHIRPYVNDIVEVRHYTRTSVVS